jgi:hypothetical protein
MSGDDEMKRVAARDIDVWSHAKLEQWFNDTMMRYSVVMNDADAMYHTISTLMSMNCYLLARVGANPSEAGAQVEKLIRNMRARLEQKNRKEK